jgi:hypothetical protein
LSLGELLWRFFGKDLGGFGNNNDVTYIQLYLQKRLERRIHSTQGGVFMNRRSGITFSLLLVRGGDGGGQADEASKLGAVIHSIPHFGIKVAIG